MSFSKIKNPKKRDDEVKKYLALKEALRLKDRMEKTGEFGRAEELSKIFKPVTSASTKLEETLSKQIKDLPSAISKALPAFSPLPAITGDILPSIKEEDEEGAVGGEEKFLIPGEPLLSKYLTEFDEHRKSLKGIFDLKIDKSGFITLNFNKKPLNIEKNFIEYDDKKYDRTDGLLELLLSEEVKNLIEYDQEDLDSFYSIFQDSNVLPVLQVRMSKKGKTQEFYSPNRKFTSNKFLKPRWPIIKPFWDQIKPVMDEQIERDTAEEKYFRSTQPTRSPMIERQEAISKETKRIMEQQGAKPKTTKQPPQPPSSGKGLKRRKNKNVVILSSDPETLVDRLTLLCSSAQAGNTGLKNEMVEICNELIRKKVMTRRQKDELLHDI